MKNIKPKILIGIWCLWLVIQLIRFILLPIPLGPALINLLVPAFCFWMGWRLFKQPSRSLTVWFFVACCLVLIKFCIGNILFYQATTHSFQAAFRMWLVQGFGSVLSFIDSIGATLLVIITFCYWPLFCYKPAGTTTNDKS